MVVSLFRLPSGDSPKWSSRNTFHRCGEDVANACEDANVQHEPDDLLIRIFGLIDVSVGPVYVSIQSGRCEHGRWANVADRAPCQGFMWFLAVIQPITCANGVQGDGRIRGLAQRARTRRAPQAADRTVGSSRASAVFSNRSRCPPRDERRGPKAPGAQSGRPD